MGTVWQYTLVYCSEKGMRKAVCIAIQTGCAGRGTGQALGAGGGARALGEQAQGVAGALGLFLIRFYSVLFLSQFLDIVREPGS